MKILGKKFFLCLIAFCFSTFAWAYELDGNASNNGDGTYSVELQNEYGHIYSGEATDNGDGTLDVTAQDSEGETYSGTATDNGDGSYSLDMENNSSGGSADGILETDD